MAVQRITSEISGFDKLVGGGFPKGSISLISGTPGTGKSIFCLQVAYFNALQGKKALYVDFEETEEDINGQMEIFGWDLKKAGKNLEIYSDHVDDADLLLKLQRKIKENKWDIIVIDSLASLLPTPAASNKKYSLHELLDTVIPVPLDLESVGRLRVKAILSILKQSGATCFVTSERIEGLPGYSRDTISEFLCDAVILTYYYGIGAVDFRSMRIIKFRRSNHEKDYILFNITSKGIDLIEDPLKNKR